MELDESRQTWTAPPELLGPVPRAVTLSAAGKAAAIAVAAIFAGAIVFYGWLAGLSARDSANRAALAASGSQTEGTVTRVWMTTGKGSHPMVAYAFDYRGREYRGSSSAPRPEWQALAEGSPIAIRFLPDRPDLNHPSRWEMDVLPGWMPPLMAVTWSLGGIVLAVVLRRQMGLLRDGAPAAGRVTEHRRARGGSRLVYVFKLPDGTMLEGRGCATRNPAAIGSELTIVYDPRRPKRNAPYPINTVRVGS